MTDFFITLGTMAAFSTAFLWLRAVHSVNALDFEWGIFFYENRNRLILQVAGCVLASTLWVIDPSGVASFVEGQGVPAFVASVAGAGLGIGYLSIFSKVRV